MENIVILAFPVKQITMSYAPSFRGQPVYWDHDGLLALATISLTLLERTFMFKALEILLVEDSVTDRFLAIEALSEVSTINHVHAVEDGVEALDFLRHQDRYSEAVRPDLGDRWY